MAKKIWYSVPLKLFWDEVYPIQKRLTPLYSDEQIYLSLLHQNATAPYVPTETEWNREHFRIGLDLWWADYNGKLLHIFFMEKRLESILSEISLQDISGIKQYFYVNGKKTQVRYKTTNEIVQCVSYSFGIHIPYETEGYAFEISIFENDVLEVFFMHNKVYGRMTEKMFKEMKNKMDEQSVSFKKYFRLAINTIAYMKIFPHCVVDGVPRITIDRNEGRSKNNVTLAVSEKMDDYQVGRKKIPHKRNWYFKYLRSDFYTKKKGQLILVRETMVNGKAKTFYTASDLDEGAVESAKLLD